MSEMTAPAAPITDVVFDFCDVLLDWQPRLPLEGQYPPGVIDMFFDPADEYGFDHYDALSDSGWSQERILADYEEHHGPAVAGVFRVYFERYELALAGMIDGMESLMADLSRAGIRMWGLTNFTTEYVDSACAKFPAMDLLRDVVVSSEERIRKPDEAIYRRAIERFGIDPAASVFFDDKPRNAEAACAVGMHGITFTDAPQARRSLRQLGVAVDA